MKSVPRILPVIAVAMGGVLGLKALSGMDAAPGVLAGAKAWAEEAVSAADKGAPAGKAEAPKAEGAAKTAAAGACPAAPAPVCAPTAAELARQAGLSPAELQVLQSLGARRTQLDEREQAMEVQIALLTAAEGKLDAKIKAMEALKGDVQALLSEADARKAAEVDRLVRVFEAMKPKDAAGRLVLLDDEVRLPIGARMKERALSAVLAQMPPQDAKVMTEKLARRFAAEEAKAALAAAGAPAPAAAPAAAPRG